MSSSAAEPICVRLDERLFENSMAQEAILRGGGSKVRRISLCSPFIGGGFELDIFPRPAEFQVLRQALVAQEDAYEMVVRRMVLRDITSDPGWYLGILGKRLFWTVTQRKLWPYRPRDGDSMEPATSPNEGSIDHYYHYTPGADTFVVWGSARELPVWILLVPGALFLLGAALAPRVPLDRRLSGTALPALGILTLGALVLPVLISTAGAQETESFVLVHLLAWALLADLAVSAVLRRPLSPASQTP